jgi:hypothetical protein
MYYLDPVTLILDLNLVSLVILVILSFQARRMNRTLKSIDQSLKALPAVKEDRRKAA